MNNPLFPFVPNRMTSFSDRLTRTESFIPIWTYKKKEKFGVGFWMGFSFSCLAVAGYTFNYLGVF